MAKKVTIQGENLLKDVQDSWGGSNNSQEAINVHGTVVPSGAEWGVNRGEVERFIKSKLSEATDDISEVNNRIDELSSRVDGVDANIEDIHRDISDIDKNKVGYQKVVGGADGISNAIVSFASEADYEQWIQLPEGDRWGEDGKSLMVTWDTLPSIEVGDTYLVNLLFESTPQQMQPNTNVSIGLKGISTITYAGGGTDNIQEVLTIEVQTRTTETGTWQNRESFRLNSNLQNWTEVSLSKYLVTGTNYIRMRPVGEFATGLVWRSVSINVVGLSLTPNTPVEIPVSGDSLILNYLVGGAADKTLRLQFGTGIGDNFVADWTYDNCPDCNITIGNSVNVSTGFTYVFTPTSLTLSDILTNGLHTVRAQLYVSEIVKTGWIETEYMVVRDEQAQPVVVINNVNANLDNYSDIRFFDWACSENMTVRFRLTDEHDTISYGNWEQDATKEISYSLDTQLGVDSLEDNIYAYMHIEDQEGNSLHGPVFISINNNQDYAPVSGPTFVFQPSTRSNSEVNPSSIINVATGEVVPSSGWDSLGMKSADGYINGSLVIPTGSQISIDYNPLSTMANTAGSESGLVAKNVTIEVDFMASNVTDESEPIVQLCSHFNTVNDKDIWGLELLPTEAALLTQQKRVRDDQNVTWAEDSRTRITFNIVYGLNPDNNPLGTKLNYVRIFLNDTIEREFDYTANDRFINSEDTQLILGGMGADLTVYNIRCYVKALSVADVMRDYRAGLPTTREKLAWMEKNDILGDNDAIDMVKAMNAGYNVIGHTGHLPTYGDSNSGSTKGVSLMIHIDGDPDHSGTLTMLDGKGQGTTAMTYKDWNQQYKITDNTVFTSESGAVSEPGTGYALMDGEAEAKKLVGKINFASSMQGHKMGLTRAYDELFKELVSNGTISKPTQMVNQPSARLTVLEKPFLFFHRNTEDDPWEFRYLMTFGAGKGDKPTFGFNKKTTPHMLMIEGADNDRTLALFSAPWNNRVVYNAENEAWYIGNQKNLNFGFGITTEVGGEEYPSDTDAIQALKDFWNFVYLHTRNINYYNGTLTELKANNPYAGGTDVPSNKVLYWTTKADSFEGTSMYDLFRYDIENDTWIKADLTGDSLNLREQYEQMCTDLGETAETWTQGQWAAINGKIQAMRTSHFAANAENYMHVDDALFHSAFVKFFAATDNRAKNTYYYTDPGTLKIRWMQDDLDTVLKTNNVGQQRKPYYVEEHDMNSAGEYYWQGESSGLYNLIEEAFSDRLTQMMRSMLSAMGSLIQGGSAIDYLKATILEAQEYFPATAYNEVARLVYERASVAQQDGTYTNNSARAISQSNGTQRLSEYQWLTDRLMYISSWCEYGEFGAGTNVSGALSFRGYSGTYSFTLTPAKWLYPRVGQGSSNVDPARNVKRVRVQAGQSFSYQTFQNDGDTTISIRGINYYSEIGDMNVPLSSTMQTVFQFFGRKLRKITVNPNGTDNNKFVTQSIEVNALNVQEIVVRGVDTLTGNIDLSNCLRLKKVDFRGSTPTTVKIPGTATLNELHLPATMTELRLRNCPNLSTFSIDGVENLRVIDCEGTPIDVFSILQRIYDTMAQGGEVAVLKEAYIRDINIVTNNSSLLSALVWAAGIDGIVISGNITFEDNITLDYKQKKQLVKGFGNIDSDNNSLRIIYSYVIDLTMTPRIYCGDGATDIFKTVGDYRLDYIPISNGVVKENANYITTVDWVLEENNYATVDEDGVLHVTAIGDEDSKPSAILTLRSHLLGGSVVEDIMTLYFWDKPIELGDYVYADGTYSSENYYTKSKVAIVFIKENNLVELIKLSPIPFSTTYNSWGLYNSSTNGVTGVTVDGTTSAYNTPMGDITTSVGFIPADTNSNYFDVSIDSFVSLGNTHSAGNFWYTPGTDKVFNTLKDENGQKVVLKAGTTYPAGYYCTLELIEWRNRILGYANLEVPMASENESEANALNRLINKISSEMGILYTQYYYVAASRSYSYQPGVRDYETLHPMFKAHKWWLPSSGELGRMEFYWRRNDTTGESKYDAFKKAKADGLVDFGTGSGSTFFNYWSSTEKSTNSAYFVGGAVSGAPNIGSGGNSTEKYNYYRVLPVCLFEP